MNDADFITAFEDTSLPDDCFHHRDHIRMAWLYLRRFPLLEALPRFTAALRRYATSRGKPDRYHETVTIGFMLMIYERMHGEPWPEFASANDDLFRWNPSVLATYYRPETLASNDARARFVLPDGDGVS